MNRVQTFVRGLTALMLAAFALPSMAAGLKLFYAEFPTVSQTSKVSVVIHNVSTANGVSTINSMQIGIASPSSGVTITGVTMTAPTAMTPTMTPAQGGNPVVITNFPGIKKQDTATFELTLSGVVSNCTSVTFFVNANSGNAYPGGDEFGKSRTDLLTTSVDCDGVLKCPSLPPTDPGFVSYTEISGANTTTLQRWENKDASVCVAIPFNLTFENGDRQINIFWNNTSQSNVALQTTTVWPLELVGGQGLPKPTLFSIGGGPSFIAPTCLSSLPPTPYGTLAAAINSSTTTITITAASLPAAPFAIIVPGTALHPERMLVQSYTGPVGGVFTASVLRAQGGTSPDTHAAAAKVVSTPLSVSTDALNGPVGTQVPVCIIKEVFETQPYGTAGCPVQPPSASSPIDQLLGCIKATSTLFILDDVQIIRN